MALLGNYSPLNANPGRAIGGFSNFYQNFKPGSMINFYTPDTDIASQVSRASFPTGTQPPYSYIVAPKGGELSSTTRIGGTGAVAANALSGRLMTADLAGTSTFEGSMSLITSMAATLAGVGAISGDMALTLAMVAELAGTGDIEGALSLLIPLASNLSGDGSISANLTGNSSLSATIYVNQSEATTQQLVAAIWSAIAADYNVAGTMGNKLNGAGSAGDPWTTDLSSYTSPGTAGQILKDNPAALEVINQNVKKASKLIPASTDI